jgi:uncharacterized protein YecE (DUF72 family)
MSQLGLDGLEAAGAPDALPPRATLAAWRARIPSLIHFGTSTWTYPGWRGLVYARSYPERGASTAMLAEYAQFPLFTTVGIDSSFYGPPVPRTLAAWARVLPSGFRCVSKVWDRITVHTFAGKREPAHLAGTRNADFLNPTLFLSEVYEPYRRYFGEHTGPFVFEFQTIAGWGRDAAREFAERLDQFLALLPRDAQYAVEVRNEEFLTPAYFETLKRHNVAHVFSSWTRMPSIGRQLALEHSVTANFLVARALLRPGRTYAEAVRLFEPYDRIRDPNPELRDDLVRLALRAIERGIPAYLLVNNRAEGSAPHTIAAVARMLAERGCR